MNELQVPNVFNCLLRTRDHYTLEETESANNKAVNQEICLPQKILVEKVGFEENQDDYTLDFCGSYTLNSSNDDEKSYEYKRDSDTMITKEYVIRWYDKKWTLIEFNNDDEEKKWTLIEFNNDEEKKGNESNDINVSDDHVDVFDPTQVTKWQILNQNHNQMTDFQEEEAQHFQITDITRFYHSFECKDGNYYQKEKEKRNVFVGIKIKHISKINTADEEFRCYFHYYFTWLMTWEEKQEYDRSNKAEWKPKWVPTIEWENRVDTHLSDIICKPGRTKYESRLGKSLGFVENEKQKKIYGFDLSKGVFHRFMHDVDMTFSEQLELQSFPFDCQDLSIYIKSLGEKSKKMYFLPIPRKGFCKFDASQSLLNEWKIENLIVEFVETNPKESRSSEKYARVIIRIKVSRNYQQFIFQIGSTFVLCFLSLGAFTLDLDNLGERLSYCVTLLLADVANQQFIYETLPNTSYATLFDNYVFSVFAFISIITAYSFTVKFFDSEFMTGMNYDELIGILFFFAFCLLHITFAIISWRRWKLERYKLYLPSIPLKKFLFLHHWESEAQQAMTANWNDSSVNQNQTKDCQIIFATNTPKSDDHNDRTCWDKFSNWFRLSNQIYLQDLFDLFQNEKENEKEKLLSYIKAAELPTSSSPPSSPNLRAPGYSTESV